MYDAAVRIDFPVQKKAKFYQEFQLTEDGTVPISLEGHTLECIIKQSYNATTNLFLLTEANGGVSKLDIVNGRFCIYIEANRTNIPVSRAVYNIKLINNEYPTTETERIIEGVLTFTNGA